MAGIVTGLRFQQHTADRVNVYLDGQYAFALPALEAARLRVGQSLDDAEIARLQATDSQQKAYDRAVRYLSFRPRSIAEVRRHLAENQYGAEIVEGVIARLAEAGYLNDTDFAQFWVENRQQFRPKGAAALRQELRQRGLDHETIAAALDAVDQTEAAYRAAAPRAQRLSRQASADPALFQRKLSEFLLRRGFDRETTRKVTAQLMAELNIDNARGEETDDLS
jgi:regulatory protein